MNILLVCPKYQFEGYTPTGLASIASIAEILGHKVTICDMNVQKLPFLGEYDLIGITGLSLWSKAIKELAEYIRHVEYRKPLPLIVGGSWATANPEKALTVPGVDYVCAGEGEETFKVFLENYPNAEGIKGLNYKDSSSIHLNPSRPFIENLDELPFPAWHLIPVEKYVKVSITSSRGCPFKCCFCAVHVYCGRRWRGRSAENVVGEIELLVTKYHVKRITFGDDNMTFNVERFEQICDLIIKKRVKTEFDVIQGVRADKLTPQLLEKMKKAGFVEIIIAPESGSQRVVDEIIHKNLDLNTVLPVVKKCKEIGLRCGAFFVVGFPWETMEEIQQTLKFAEKLRSLKCSAYVGNALPLLHTELYEKAKAEGFLRFDSEQLEDYIVNLGLPRKDHALTSPYWKPEDIVKICAHEHKKNLRSIYSHYSVRQMVSKTFKHPLRALKKIVGTI